MLHICTVYIGNDLHRLTLCIVRECQMTRRLVTSSRPRSPEFPLVSSMLSSLSIRISPGLIFICLEFFFFSKVDKKYRLITTYDTKMSNLTSRCSQMESTAAPSFDAMFNTAIKILSLKKFNHGTGTLLNTYF